MAGQQDLKKHSDFSGKNSSSEVQVTQFVFSSSPRSYLDLLSSYALPLVHTSFFASFPAVGVLNDYSSLFVSCLWSFF